jgi:hypothetical protein
LCGEYVQFAWSRSTPRKQHCAGLPPTAQTTLQPLPPTLADGTYNALLTQLRDYLICRLAPDAAERHIAAGHGASATFEALQDQRLTRPNEAQILSGPDRPDLPAPRGSP